MTQSEWSRTIDLIMRSHSKIPGFSANSESLIKIWFCKCPPYRIRYKKQLFTRIIISFRISSIFVFNTYFYAV